MANIIQIKRGLEANLPILAAGEFGFALDTGNLYCGNGTTNVHINPPGGVADVAIALQNTRYFTGTGGDVVFPSVGFNGTADVDLVLDLVASGVVAGTYGKVTVNSKGIVTTGAQLEITDIEGLGTAAAADIGHNQGNIPTIGADGYLPSSIIPTLAITDIFVVADETEMLALTAEQGDIAIRSDVSRTYILQQAPASVLSNWVVLQTPTAPVLSVNGQIGVVELDKADIGLGNVENETNAQRHVGKATVLDPGAEINGVLFTGAAPITIYDNTKMPTTGGIFTGDVTFAEDAILDTTQGVLVVANPESANHAANKGYVDTAISSGTAGKALELANAQNFSIAGDATAPVISFNGTQPVALQLTLADSGVAAGTYTKVTVDSKGRVITGAQITATDVGLENVVNLAPADMTVGKADQLTTSQNFQITGGATAAAVAFNGTAGVNLVVTELDATLLVGVIDGGTF